MTIAVMLENERLAFHWFCIPVMHFNLFIADIMLPAASIIEILFKAIKRIFVATGFRNEV
ncbi:hypothetical protein ASE74_21770 [Pedobacter sp. Leaf216]|nr:hypothetical protein ASE74_21770 [Pedobacter sp. Leaf216]